MVNSMEILNKSYFELCKQMYFFDQEVFAFKFENNIQKKAFLKKNKEDESKGFFYKIEDQEYYILYPSKENILKEIEENIKNSKLYANVNNKGYVKNCFFKNKKEENNFLLLELKEKAKEYIKKISNSKEKSEFLYNLYVNSLI